MGAPLANKDDSPLNFSIPLQLLGYAISSGGKFINSSLNSCMNVFSIFSSPVIMILSACFNFSRQGAGVLDLTASTPIIFNCGVLYRTPSLSHTLRIYLFFAAQIPRSAITSLPITIFCS